MRDNSISRWEMIKLGFGTAVSMGTFGCGRAREDSAPDTGNSYEPHSVGTIRPARPLGDGSTSYTGKQPHQPGKPEPLEPGQEPPQFVV
ncbi:hypothetical protein AB0N62_45985, partial [Streptomyces sp. NPDC093982]